MRSRASGSVTSAIRGATSSGSTRSTAWLNAHARSVRYPNTFTPSRPASRGERYHMPDGTLVHAELLIGDSVVMVKDAQEDEFKALLCTYWPDVDAAWERAVGGGAEVIYPPPDHF